jgi:Mrp family chromosome partitioning ATPase
VSRIFDSVRRAEEARSSFPAQGGRSEGGGVNYPAQNKNGAVQQEELALVQRVFLSRGEKAPRVVVFCSAQGGDPSSGVCACTGAILAMHGTGSVCLVDANPYSASLGGRFGANGEPGLADALLNGSSVCTLTRKISDNLWLLSSGSGSCEGKVIPTAQQLKNCLSDLRARFDYVLVDAPPANTHADALLFGQLADGVILVLKSNATRREEALRAKANLMAANARLMGVVLTDRTFPIPRSIYRRL